MRPPAVLCLVTTMWLAVGNGLQGADLPADQAEFFEKQVRPILVNRCEDCHNEDSPESGLQVDSLEGLLRGGDRGPAIVPGKPGQSLIIGAVKHSGQIFMPPKEKIPRREITVLAKWIEMGAPWPGAKPVTVERKADDAGPLFTDEERSFWAFQPPQRPALPEVGKWEWVRSPIDTFILAKLESAGLAPAPAADKLTLIRRATFDLTGLPPTPQEVDAFLADESDDAFAALVERLLASPQYGVRWGRHWLDLARYADSNGLDENLAYANAYRYRDYVIDAFNADKPYDRFVQEQLAGDLLPTESVAARLDGIAATGFLSIGAKMLAEDDPVKMRMDIVDEQIDTVGKAFWGLTLGCGRCHDHKFDPFPMEDYYSLAGIFKSTKTMETYTVVARWNERPLASDSEIQLEQQQQLTIDEKQAGINRLVAETNEALQREARSHLADYLLAAEYERQRDLALLQVKPFGADAATSGRSDFIRIEAENYTRGNARKDFEGYGKGIGVILNRGEMPNIAEYEVSIAEPGLYQLELRYAAAEPRPCRLLIDDSLIKANAASQATGSWNPDTQSWFVELVHNFEHGNHKILLERDGPFPHLDQLLIAPIPAKLVESFSGLREMASPSQDGLHPAFVQQWKKSLEQAQSDSQSPLALWQAFVDDGQLPAEPSGGGSLRAEFFTDPRPQTLSELAARYQRVFARLDEDPQASPAPDAGNDAPADADGNGEAETDDAETKGDAERKAWRDFLHSPQGPFAVPQDIATMYPPDVTEQLAAQRDELKRLQESKITLPLAMAVAEGTPENVPIHIRGSHMTLGKVVPRRFPRILAGEQVAPIGDDRSGRLELARWMTEPDHPLTSRVMVNRLWQWHFGEGLVRTPDNFGRLGERPTHPQLLDWLAVQFVESGWSIKAMHRLIMLSATYQMSTAYDADAAAQDAENRLWWRRNRRRLEAEAIRDAILAVAGNLDLTMGGSLLPTENRKYVTSTANVNPIVYNSNRRSVYLPVVRSAVYEVFQAFDFADPSMLDGKRISTTVAPQALFMMNSQLVAEHAKMLAEQLLKIDGEGDGKDNESDDAARVRALYRRVLSRPPTAAETKRAIAYLDRVSQALESLKHETDKVRLVAWHSLCRAVIASNEFLFIE